MLAVFSKLTAPRVAGLSRSSLIFPATQTRQYAASKTKQKNFPPRKVIPEEEIQEVFIKGGGKGGQKINKTSSKVQLTHLPTGIVVNSQYTRSQLQNRKEARRILYDRVEQHLNPDHNRIDMILAWKKSLSKKALSKKIKKYSKHKHDAILKRSDDAVGSLYSVILNDIMALRFKEDIILKHGSEFSPAQCNEFLNQVTQTIPEDQREYIEHLQASMRNDIALLINALNPEKKPLEEEIFDLDETDEDIGALEVKYGEFADAQVHRILYEANRTNMEDVFGTTNFTPEQGLEYMRRWSLALTEHQRKLQSEFRILHLIRIYNICSLDK